MEFQKWSLADLWETYYQHYFFDNPKDVEFIGYEENVSETGVKYYKFEGDKLLSRCEELIGQGRDEEAYALLNQGVDFSWESTIQDDIIKKHQKLNDEVKKEQDKARTPVKSNFLESMGVTIDGE